MAVQLVTTIHSYVGLSSDAKPQDVNNGSRFLELDTQLEYVYDNESRSWKPKNSPAVESLTGRLNVVDVLEQINGNIKEMIEILKEKL